MPSKRARNKTVAVPNRFTKRISQYRRCVSEIDLKQSRELVSQQFNFIEATAIQRCYEDILLETTNLLEFLDEFDIGLQEQKVSYQLALELQVKFRKKFKLQYNSRPIYPQPFPSIRNSFSDINELCDQLTTELDLAIKRGPPKPVSKIAFERLTTGMNEVMPRFRSEIMFSSLCSL